MLILIATPIGNLRDISDRAREALETSDAVCCEDTRHTGLLFQALHIPRPRLLSFHKFNEASREEELVALLREGKKVAVVSDAGMPAVADPGATLVARCHREGIPVTIIPGPCAFVSAFALSGADGPKMQFLGFLPKTDGERGRWLRQAAQFDGCTVVYESPNRLAETVKAAAEIDGTWEVVLVRELTKLHEEVVRRPARELVELLKDREVQGECVLVFLPLARKERPSDGELIGEVASIRNQFACSVKEAIEVVADRHQVSRRELYALCLQFSNQAD